MYFSLAVDLGKSFISVTCYGKDVNLQLKEPFKQIFPSDCFSFIGGIWNVHDF